MCGVAGIVSLGIRPERTPDASAVERMVQAMRHRGPDAQGTAELGAAVLGSCRLKIIDLDSASNQPLRSADSECAVVFNGEIYNYIELREELRTRGHIFSSKGDTEVIVHAYEEWGLACLSRLNGMFAFAVADPRDRSVFVARDRFGVKPIYYAEVGSQLVFASEPRALLASGLVSPGIDEHTVLDYLEFGVTDIDERTFFAEICQLRPGHYLVVKNGGFEIRQWYGSQILSPRRKLEWDWGSITKEFRTRMEDSLRLRMRSDVDVGTLLSGGIDSSSIVALEGLVFDPATLHSFCVGFPGSRLDESKYAVAVAAASGIPITVAQAARVEEETINDCVRAQFEPFPSPSIIAQWLIMKAVGKAGFRVLLSGQGADEYLAGYEYFDAYAVFEWVAQGKFRTALRHLLHQRNRQRIPSIVAGAIFLALPQSIKRRRWRPRWMRHGVSDHPTCGYFSDLAKCRTLDAAIAFHLRVRLPQLLRFEDRSSMAFSIETRHPFLDFNLVEFVRSLDSRAVVSAGRRKRILVDSVRGIVPDVILARKDKIGFQPPPEWIQSQQFRDSFDRLMVSAPEWVSKIVDFRRLKNLFRASPSRWNVNQIWRVYNLLAWNRVLLAEAEAWKAGSTSASASPSGGSNRI